MNWIGITMGLGPIGRIRMFLPTPEEPWPGIDKILATHTIDDVEYINTLFRANRGSRAWRALRDTVWGRPLRHILRRDQQNMDHGHGPSTLNLDDEYEDIGEPVPSPQESMLSWISNTTENCTINHPPRYVHVHGQPSSAGSEPEEDEEDEDFYLFFPRTRAVTNLVRLQNLPN